MSLQKTIDTNGDAQNHSFNGNGSTIKNHWKNHRYQWLNFEEKNIDNNGSLVKKTIEKPLTTMVPCQKTIAIPLWSKIDHRYGLD